VRAFFHEVVEAPMPNWCARKTSRGLMLDSDIIPIQLRRRENSILFKILQVVAIGRMLHCDRAEGRIRAEGIASE
jgi:hypothetical protein